ncbi:MAG: endonuclease domain-containing protein [Candidatus Dormibacteraeota bacterium]|nr:endonuclease domain-containing protein [Candidatus Dormibacteraeota bacterium]
MVRACVHGSSNPSPSSCSGSARPGAAAGDVQDRRRLWYRLRSRQLLGCKFRRQVPVGPYFADFACLEARLVLEVDGDHHGDQLVYDARRDHWLGEMGFRVLRFRVAEIDENIEGVKRRPLPTL